MSSRGPRLLRAVGLTTLASVLWIVPLEAGARHWIDRHGDPLDRSMRVLEADPFLGWRQRRNFRGTFIGAPLQTNALGLRNRPMDPYGDRQRVLILGPSSTFGWGIAEEATYARQLEGALRAARNDPALEVINAGEIGFSSWQGAELYRRELRALRPGVVVIAYGANDVDRHRFFFDDRRPDEESLGEGKSPAVIDLVNLAARLQFFQVARRGAARLLGRMACSAAAHNGSAVPPVRVSVDGYRRNLEELIALVRADGAHALLLTTAFSLPEPDSQPCDAHYALAAERASRGECAAAREALAQARAAEPARVAADFIRYNNAARKVAQEAGVPIVDAQGVLAEGPREALFLDPVHFTAEGNTRLADALSSAILKEGWLQR